MCSTVDASAIWKERVNTETRAARNFQDIYGSQAMDSPGAHHNRDFRQHGVVSPPQFMNSAACPDRPNSSAAMSASMRQSLWPTPPPSKDASARPNTHQAKTPMMHKQMSAPVIAWQPSSTEIYNQCRRIEEMGTKEMREIENQRRNWEMDISRRNFGSAMHSRLHAAPHPAFEQDTARSTGGDTESVSPSFRSGMDMVSPKFSSMKGGMLMGDSRYSSKRDLAKDPRWKQMMVDGLDERKSVAMLAGSRRSGGRPDDPPSPSAFSPNSTRKDSLRFTNRRNGGAMSTSHLAHGFCPESTMKTFRGPAAGGIANGIKSSEEREFTFLTRG